MFFGELKNTRLKTNNKGQCHVPTTRVNAPFEKTNKIILFWGINLSLKNAPQKKKIYILEEHELDLFKSKLNESRACTRG